ncbi:MAG: nitroreductase [Mesorhizobium sp.]|uniref:nitroreductase family protein n=1 Tax=Mesorhizobium sp. TaxID=1871066 RepID=UPI000FE49E89|nr:nitroreductase family protein [Mesorhizobium sp.]RWM00951.1 MAG: nitroreductase [Mesorhizobium sp.]TIP46153.1 MAG: nitroreductase [Mesorhizobium sp.]
MELMVALRTRRAVRVFTGEPVDDITVEELVGAAVLAPSAVNLQPWAFAVVRGTERLHALSAEASRYALAHLPAGSPLATHVADPAFEIFHGAAVLVVICAIDGERQSSEDCCLAGENFMLAAHAKGLGTCWIGLSRAWLNDPSVKAELGIPADWHPTAPIVLGHPSALPAPTPRKKIRIVWCR